MLDHKCFSICNSNYCILLKFKFCKGSSQSFIYLLLLAQCTLLHYSSTRCPLLLETNSLKYCCCHDNCNFNKMYETFNAVVLTGTCYYIVVTKEVIVNMTLLSLFLFYFKIWSTYTEIIIQFHSHIYHWLSVIILYNIKYNCILKAA